MMLLCQICNKLISTGERIKCSVEADYVSLKSERSWAIDPNGMHCDLNSVTHATCGGFEDASD